MTDRTKCGCEVRWNRFEWTIRSCPLHESAPDLLAELKRLSETRDVCLCGDLYKADRPCDCCAIAAAIAKAEGGGA